MSRVSSLVFGTVVTAILAAVSGCRVSVETKERFVEKDVVQTDSADWNGEPIEINIAGVGISVNGGVTVVSSPSTTRVKATARMLAMAFAEEKANADQSIVEAKQTFTISNSGGTINVNCGHGQSHGSSNGGESGCEFVQIEVPAGAQDKPLVLRKVLSGNGDLVLQLSNAYLTELGTNSNGGDTNADLPAVQGATLSLVSEKADDIAIKLPSNFAADEVILQADADKIQLGPFSDVKNGTGAGGRGTAGTGLKVLKATSKEFAGSTGTIFLQ